MNCSQGSVMSRCRASRSLRRYSSLNKNRSAIPPGRMRQTDTIKGKDCPLPAEPGIYRHVNKKSGEVDYVGQTDNIRKRQQEHAREGNLNPVEQQIVWAQARSDATRESLLQTEKDHIGRHNPSGNTYKGGNGRRGGRVR